MKTELEILKKEYPLICDMSFEWGWKSCEEAMKTKTCDRCAYCAPFNSVCFNDKSPLCADSVNSEYGCIYWERKDNA